MRKLEMRKLEKERVCGNKSKARGAPVEKIESSSLEPPPQSNPEQCYGSQKQAYLKGTQFRKGAISVDQLCDHMGMPLGPRHPRTGQERKRGPVTVQEWKLTADENDPVLKLR